MNARRTAMTMSLALLGLTVALLWLVTDQPALAVPAEWTVCPGGLPGCDFATIQDGVDAAADGDVVKIATGLYTDVHRRPVPAGYPYPPPGGVITQVVYLSKTLTLRGGYPPGFGGPPNPIAHPTTLDAGGRGRVLVIVGHISPTVEGLTMTGGDAADMNGSAIQPWDAGGGVYVISATAMLMDNQIVSNTISEWGFGGGMYLHGSPATLANNFIAANSSLGWMGAATGSGLCLHNSDAWLGGNIVSANTAGGLYLLESDATLVGNTISGNTSNSTAGGGVYLHASHATLSGNIIRGNSASLIGGGVYVQDSDATLEDNTILSNTIMMYGGGLYLRDSRATLNRNTIAHNTALGDGDGEGGGLALYCSDATLTNNLVADNQASVSGSGLFIQGGAPRLLHTTIARNRGGDGSGIAIVQGVCDEATVALTNTILVSHSLGITIAAGHMATLEATLWGTGTWANDVDWSGAGTLITGMRNYWGDPAFVHPDVGDYRIGPDSAALDRGVDAGVQQDLGRQPRPYQEPDLGADEYWPYCVLECIYLPLVLHNAP